MNSIYTFYLNKRPIKICASDYKNAIEKACIVLEDKNDEVDLLGLENWKDVQEECSYYNLHISDLIRDEDE